MSARDEGWVSGDDGVYEVAMTEAERLEAAADVVRSLQGQISLLKEIAESLRDQVLHDKREMDTVLASCRDIARQLALSGNGSHRDKSGAMMSAVARLLTLEYHYSEQKPRDMEDIPF